MPTTKGVAANAVGQCVFISHKREDWQLALEIAGVLGALDLDFWLDLNELAAGEPSSADEHVALASAIEAGLDGSSHLLALITPNTRGSMWVPFEIGSARARRRPLAFLIHKDVQLFPSYFAFGTRLGDQEDLYRWAAELSPFSNVAKSTAQRLLANESRLEKFIPKFRFIR